MNNKINRAVLFNLSATESGIKLLHFLSYKTLKNITKYCSEFRSFESSCVATDKFAPALNKF